MKIVVEGRANGYPIVDGIITPEKPFGEKVGGVESRRRFRTELPKGYVDLEKCKELVENLRSQNFEANGLKIYLCSEKFNEKTVTYNAKENRLRVWENNDLVYQNWDGVISKDPVALADTYM